MNTIVLKLKEDTVEGYAWKETKKMKQRFDLLKTIKIDKPLIAEIGICVVRMTADAWPEELRDAVVQPREFWKRATSGLAIIKCKSCTPHERAFDGMKPTEFVKKVDNIAYFWGNTDGNFAE